MPHPVILGEGEIDEEGVHKATKGYNERYND